MYKDKEKSLMLCPFCGSPGEIVKDRFPPENPFWHPSCSNYECVAYVEGQDEQGGTNVDRLSREEAAELWNRRTGTK